MSAMSAHGITTTTTTTTTTSATSAIATSAPPRSKTPQQANTLPARKARRPRATKRSASAISALPPQYLAFLVEAGATLSSPLDHERVLSTTGELAVPALADFAALYLADEQGEMQLEHCWHSETTHGARLSIIWKRSLSQLAADSPFTPGVAAELRSLFHSTSPILISTGPGRSTNRRFKTQNFAALIASMGLRSAIFITLHSAGQPIGALVLCATGLARYESAELAVAWSFALLAENALAHERQITALQHATRQRQQWAAGIAHDLTSSLSVIKMQAQYLRRVTSGPRESEAEEPAPTLATLTSRVAQLEATVASTTSLLDDMTDLIENESAERLVLQRETADLVALARHAVATYQELSDRHHIILMASQERLVGYWDRRKLERMIGNLLTNAVKYSPDGGHIVVEVKRARGGRAGVRAVLRIRDEGIGISEAEIPHIFEPFHRARGVAGRIPGMGLGLANVRRIVEGHGGSILVASEPGAGSTFTILLPLAHDSDNAP